MSDDFIPLARPSMGPREEELVIMRRMARTAETPAVRPVVSPAEVLRARALLVVREDHRPAELDVFEDDVVRSEHVPRGGDHELALAGGREHDVPLRPVIGEVRLDLRIEDELTEEDVVCMHAAIDST